ncbi:10764_t:CDS:2, partial [Racocetra fulgida]
DNDYAESTALPSKPSANSKRQKHSCTPEEIEEIINDTYFLKLDEKRPFFTRKRVVFTAGIILGIFIASVLAPGAPDFLPESFSDLDFTSILPAHILVEELFGNITLFLKPNISILEDTEFMPGLSLSQEGVKANFPVVLIPGIVSTKVGAPLIVHDHILERESVLLDKECWESNMRLNPITGLDPPDVKLRAAQ